MTEKYKFDNAYESIYEWNDNANAYLFLGSYYSFGITKEMSHAEAVAIIENDFEFIESGDYQ